MSFGAVVGMLVFAVGMVVGQLLYRLAAGSINRAGRAGDLIISIIFNPMLWAAALLYVSLSIYWVWLLSFTPLSRAYPFQALAFVLVPMVGVLLFQEPFTVRLAIGIVVIIAGIVIISG